MKNIGSSFLEDPSLPINRARCYSLWPSVIWGILTIGLVLTALVACSVPLTKAYSAPSLPTAWRPKTVGDFPTITKPSQWPVGPTYTKRVDIARHTSAAGALGGQQGPQFIASQLLHSIMRSVQHQVYSLRNTLETATSWCTTQVMRVRHFLLVLLLTFTLWVGPVGLNGVRGSQLVPPAMASTMPRGKALHPEPRRLIRDKSEVAEMKLLLNAVQTNAKEIEYRNEQAKLPLYKVEKGRSAWKKFWRRSKSSIDRRMSPSEIDPATDLRSRPRHVAIFTTAALPWMTGTSVNPLLRAVYLSSQGLHDVTLVVPWLPDQADQARLFPKRVRFDNPDQQEHWIRNWLETKAGVSHTDASRVKLKWYPARYSPLLGSVFHRQVMVDLTSDKIIPDEEADVAILEEPEHLNWFHHGGRWTDHFNHVVGIVHTNYLEYSINDTQRDFLISAGQPVVTTVLNRLTCQYTDMNIKLSGVLMKLPRDKVCNVNGVQPKFLEIGRKVEEATHHTPAPGEAPAAPVFTKGAYFLGKALWAKGYSEFLTLYDKLKDNWPGEIDFYGSGEDSAAIRAAAEDAGAPFRFHDGIDHASDEIQQYKVFVNPSKSEVLCTATAEALAMGKVCVIAKHPSNEFFEQFSNVYTFSNAKEFREQLKRALQDEPRPLGAEERRILSWEAATERLLDSVALPKRAWGEPRPALSAEANLAYLFHYTLGMEPMGDLIRDITGSGVETPWEERPWHPSQATKLVDEAKAYARESAEALERRLQDQIKFTKQYTEESSQAVERRVKEQAKYAKRLVEDIETQVNRRLRQLEEEAENLKGRFATGAGKDARREQLLLFRQEWIQEWLAGRVPLEKRIMESEKAEAANSDTKLLTAKEVYDRAVEALRKQWATLKEIGTDMAKDMDQKNQ